ncbi:MAG: hypothetical protein IKR70_05990 [Lachnospiraceae bacterium]|nr:hypothetical protein [Lachnospiraceae bacterium]
MPELLEISEEIFDNKKDVTGKKNIYNEKSHYMYWVFFQMVNQLQNPSFMISPEKQAKIYELIGTIMEKEKRLSSDKNAERKNDDYVEGNGNKVPYINMFNVGSYIGDEDIDWAREEMKAMQDMYLQIADKVDEPLVKDFYRGYAGLLDMTKGNILKALEDNVYLDSLMSETIAGLKTGAGKPIEQAIMGLKGTHPDMANLPENQRQNIFDDFLTAQNGFFGELDAEYLRQKIEKGNWEDQDKIQEYTEKIRYEHRKIIDAFERLVQVENVGQYDKYLENTFNHLIERVDDGPVRGLTSTVFTMKAELRALDNGWGPRDMGLLGTLGGIEGGFDKYKSFYTNKKDNKKLSRLNELAGEFKLIKDKWWNKKNPTSEEKLEFANEIKSFMVKHSNSLEIRATSITLSRFNKTVENIKADLALEKGVNAGRKMIESEFDNMIGYYDSAKRVDDRTKGLAQALNEGLEGNAVLDEWKNNHGQGQNNYANMINAVKTFEKDLKDRTPWDIHKNLEIIIENAQQIMDMKAEYKGNKDFMYIADACKQLKDIADDCLKDLNDNYKSSVPVDVKLGRSMEVMTKTTVGKAETYKAEFVKDGGNLLDEKASEFEVVGDEEIHEAKIAAVDYKHFMSDPENAAKVEANAKKNLAERKAREKNKDKITIKDLEREEKPDMEDDKENNIIKVQSKKSVSNEKGIGKE